MKLKELIELLQEYERMFGPDTIVITRKTIVEVDEEDKEIFRKEADSEIDGIDYIGHGTILILTHSEDED